VQETTEGPLVTDPKGAASATPQPAVDAPRLPLIWNLFREEDLPQRLLLTSKMIERVTARQLQDQFNISVAQWRVLGFTCIAGPSSATFIGDSAEVDQAEISRAVKSLLDRGLVTRTYAKGSRKTLVIAPSPAGRDLFEQVQATRRAYFGKITRRLEPRHREAVAEVLRLIAEDVVADRDQGPRS